LVESRCDHSIVLVQDQKPFVINWIIGRSKYFKGLRIAGDSFRTLCYQLDNMTE